MELLNTIGYLFNTISITILIFGIFFTAIQKKHKDKNWLLAYLILILNIEALPLLIVNIFSMFTLGFFIHFLFLTHFYCLIIFKMTSIQRNKIFCLGLLPFLLSLLPEPYYYYFQYYERVPYSFTIMLYSLMYFYALISGSIATIHSRNILNGAVLLFFTLDLFLALGTKFMIAKDLLALNSSFWSIRAISLQLLYIALINYGWKSSKSQVELSKTS
jgi:hypothetical protein